MDRRIRKTQRAILDALRRLMSFRPWDQISVNDLCAEADISRSTFYAHFDSKFHLLSIAFEDLEALLQQPQNNRGLDQNGKLSFLPEFLKHVHSHKEIFMMNESTPSAAALFGEAELVIYKAIEREISHTDRYENLSHICIQFLSGGISAVVRKWVEAGCKQKIQKILGELDSLVSPTLSLMNK